MLVDEDKNNKILKEYKQLKEVVGNMYAYNIQL